MQLFLTVKYTKVTKPLGLNSVEFGFEPLKLLNYAEPVRSNYLIISGLIAVAGQHLKVTVFLVGREHH